MTYISERLRQQVAERAGSCCEYCLYSETFGRAVFHVEHIIAVKHNGATDLDNLCLSCPVCNLNKGSDISSIDWDADQAIVRLYHPRRDVWQDNFRLEGNRIRGTTAVGRVTVFLLQFNCTMQLERREELLKTGGYPCRK